MNLNVLAKTLCEMDKGKREYDITAAKKLIKRLGSLLGTLPGDEAMALVNKIIKAGAK